MSRSACVLILAVAVTGTAVAQSIPAILNYQGRVAVGTTNVFTGTGQFRFALVDGVGAATYWSNGVAAVTTPVNRGLFAIRLGDTGLANMAAIPASAFAHTDVRVRVWFAPLGAEFRQLAPDQRVSGVAYAMLAGDVADGAITGSQLADGVVTRAKLAPGAAGVASLGPGGAASNLASNGLAAVGRGGTVLAAVEDPGLVAAGYVRVGTIQVGESWQQRLGGTAPSARAGYTAVWDGSEMLVWGGQAFNGFDNTFFQDGARYDPAANIWTPIATNGAPSGRSYHTAVWDGSVMIVWGGSISDAMNGSRDGGRYNPVANTWAPVTTTGAPSQRMEHVAVWDGSEMLVWGGCGISYISLNDGGRYNPVLDTWSAMTNAGAPGARSIAVAVWDGLDMIVWGGSDLTTTFGDGGRYNPASNTWSAVTTHGAPCGRSYCTAVWDGREMIIWGGEDINRDYLYDGARYDPVANAWTNLQTMNAPSGRAIHTAIWSGSEMIVWGGYNGTAYFNDGARYNPAANSWSYMNPYSGAAAPSARAGHAAIWDGHEMIIWGGEVDPSLARVPWCYTPGKTMILYAKP